MTLNHTPSVTLNALARVVDESPPRAVVVQGHVWICRCTSRNITGGCSGNQRHNLPLGSKSPIGFCSRAGYGIQARTKTAPAVVCYCLSGLNRPRCRGAHGDPGRSVAAQLNSLGLQAGPQWWVAQLAEQRVKSPIACRFESCPITNRFNKFIGD